MRTRSGLALAALLLLAALPLPPGAAQPEEQLRKVLLPGETRELVSRLEAADRLAARKLWTEALDEYQRLLNENGDDLVPENGLRDRAASTRRSVQLRRLCHLRLAALPPATRARYRTRVDPQAKRSLQQGTEGHDVEALRRIVDEAFLSRFADRAIDLLGDLAFERGNFAAARHWWQLLAPGVLDAPDPARLVFPDPTLDVARVRAKQVLARLFEGDLQEARAELTAYRRQHAKAVGQLAGRDGNYAETVQALMDRRKAGPLSPEEENWPTFAGGSSRNRILTDELSERLWAHGAAWRVRLDRGEEPAPRFPSARRLPCHPVIADKQVLVADTRRVTAYDVRSGKKLFRYDIQAGRKVPLELPPTADVPCTLTVAGDHVYARLGAQALLLSGKEKRGATAAPSYLVCLDRFPLKGAAAGGRERWLVKATGAEGERTAFEGAPLAHDGCVYVAQSSLAPGRLRTALLCLDADSGALRWRRDVCETPDGEGPAPRRRHHLLTLAGGALVYCSHAGAVVAVDPLTGKRLWGVRYPRRGARGATGDPAPCVGADWRVFVAPLDSDRILCLDAGTGRTLWEREGIEVAHLLGVSRGRLIFTTTAGVRALTAATGGDEGGWRQPAVGKLPGFGRGLLAGHWVLWPTQDEKLPLRALNQEDGSQELGGRVFDPTRLRRLAPGNMAFGNGCLVVAGTEEMVGYVPPALR